MYKHCDLDDSYINLHDCCVEKINFDNGILSFIFPNGFWIMQQHSLNNSENTVLTSSSQVSFSIIDKKIDGIKIYMLNEENGIIVREKWNTIDFINAVNNGYFKIEFTKQYKSYQCFHFECWVWFDKEPYYSGCEIILYSENALYYWNDLRYDCCW
ncbi:MULTISPECIES: hypothetical protein [Fusobacterium]|uniref:hypothetical protein n=1 Tax=Fusobacterium TaxID=848 RepID=UPI0014771511|nr:MULTISPECIES: hypothetical protein [Fusobacterium]NME35166.1 hypothetical protein [Fusobacterium sp. FSA-380-WT-3A]